MAETAGATALRRKDKLIRCTLASRVLGVSGDVLDDWHAAGFMPQVRTPGLNMTFESWVDAVMGAVRPRKAADVAVIGRQWFADRGLTGDGEAAA
jgi:hypothetical protein